VLELQAACCIARAAWPPLSCARSPACVHKCRPSSPALSTLSLSLPLPSPALSSRHNATASSSMAVERSFQPAVAAPTDGLRPSFVGARLGPAAPPPPPAARPSARPMAEPTALQSRPRSRMEPRRRTGRCPRPPPVNAGAGRGHHLGRASLPSRISSSPAPFSSALSPSWPRRGSRCRRCRMHTWPALHTPPQAEPRAPSGAHGTVLAPRHSSPSTAASPAGFGEAQCLLCPQTPSGTPC